MYGGGHIAAHLDLGFVSCHISGDSNRAVHFFFFFYKDNFGTLVIGTFFNGYQQQLHGVLWVGVTPCAGYVSNVEM